MADEVTVGPPKRDPRRAKQYGDFGESLVMYLLTGYRDMKVAVVDHAGADLIASDLDSGAEGAGRYAVSVKSRTLNLQPDGTLESRLIHLTAEHLAHLKEFGESFGLTPVLALVMTLPPLPKGDPRIARAEARTLRDGKKRLWPRAVPVTAVFMFEVEAAEQALLSPDSVVPKWLSPDIGGGFNFKFSESYFNEILEDPRIDFAELTINSIGNGALWSGE